MQLLPPISLFLALIIALLLCRPWLDARRPIMSLALLFGFAIGHAGANLVPDELLARMTPVAALCSGWLALLAAESWDGPTLRRAGWGLKIVWLVVPAVAIGWYFGAIVIACAAIALDPDAVREGLRLTARPTTASRQAPTIAAIALGLALLVSCLSDPRGPLAGAPAPLAGAVLGLLYTGLLRLAEGKWLVLTLLIALPILGAGIAYAFEMPALAGLFVAGVLLAQDASRRDLVFSTLREYERPVTAGMLLLAGVMLPAVLDEPVPLSFWLAMAILLLVKPFVWCLIPSAGLTWRQVVAIAPLMIPVAAAAGAPWITLAVALVFVAGELLSRLPERHIA